jgi:mono/diheme cytochrome c family protein
MPTLAAVSSLLAVAAASAQEVGDLQRGRQIARDICAACHAVEAGEQRSPAPAAPSFQSVADTPGMTGTAVEVWLTAHPHDTMPMIVLSREEVGDISAYILSLRN